MREVLSEFDVSAAVKRVPDYSFFRPEQGDEEVFAFRVARCWHVEWFSAFAPARLYFWQEVYPFFVLERESNLFFKRAAETRL